MTLVFVARSPHNGITSHLTLHYMTLNLDEHLCVIFCTFIHHFKGNVQILRIHKNKTEFGHTCNILAMDKSVNIGVKTVAFTALN